MCGRFTLAADAATIINHFKISGTYDHTPRYNIAPGQQVSVIARCRSTIPMRWGLVPHWSRDPKAGYKMINARAETIEQRPAFRDAFKNRRCLIPADGFYEWTAREGKKLPLRIVLPGRPVFALAGIWDWWTAPDGDHLLTFCIVTTEANDFMKKIHGRMPVILTDEQQYSLWLQSGRPVNELLCPYSGIMEIYPVDPLVNSPRVDVPECIERSNTYW